MSSTLTTTCPLCGLRFPGRPLLDLHMREDHRERNSPAGPDRGDYGETSGDGADGLSGDEGLASGQAGIAHEEAIAMTTKQQSRSERAMTALRRAIGVLKSPVRAGRDAQPASQSRADRSA
jgi:hypothetical protein